MVLADALTDIHSQTTNTEWLVEASLCRIQLLVLSSNKINQSSTAQTIYFVQERNKKYILLAVSIDILIQLFVQKSLKMK